MIKHPDFIAFVIAGVIVIAAFGLATYLKAQAATIVDPQIIALREINATLQAIEKKLPGLLVVGKGEQNP